MAEVITTNGSTITVRYECDSSPGNYAEYTGLFIELGGGGFEYQHYCSASDTYYYLSRIYPYTYTEVNNMASVTHRANWSVKHTVTAAEASAGYVQIDFGSSYDLAYNVTALASNGANLALTGAIITNPSTGVIKIANGGSLTLAENQVLIVNAHANSSDYS